MIDRCSIGINLSGLERIALARIVVLICIMPMARVACAVIEIYVRHDESRFRFHSNSCFSNGSNSPIETDITPGWKIYLADCSVGRVVLKGVRRAVRVANFLNTVYRGTRFHPLNLGALLNIVARPKIRRGGDLRIKWMRHRETSE